jgi:pimeloyl-ACP methyl ester carboxylesterase
MAQTHWVGRPFPFGIKSTAFWSIHPKRKLLVFVHGFRGSALDTWDNFSMLMQKRSKFADYDVIFYGYDGFRVSASSSGANLHSALDQFLTNPVQYINSTLAPPEYRPTTFDYDKVLLVGHSLGAVVLRRAIVDAHLKSRAWVKRIDLAFFAPAHLGADIIELASQVITGIPYIGKLLSAGIKVRGTVLHDLLPNSQMLTLLLSDTVAAAATGATYVAAREVWFGEYENVVSTVRFGPDPIPGPPIPKKGHINVCKPKDKALQPIVDLEKLL